MEFITCMYGSSFIMTFKEPLCCLMLKSLEVCEFFHKPMMVILCVNALHWVSNFKISCWTTGASWQINEWTKICRSKYFRFWSIWAALSNKFQVCSY